MLLNEKCHNSFNLISDRISEVCVMSEFETFFLQKSRKPSFYPCYLHFETLAGTGNHLMSKSMLCIVINIDFRLTLKKKSIRMF